MSIRQRLSSIIDSVLSAGSLTAALGAAGRTAASNGADPRASVAFTAGLIALAAKMAKSDGVVTGDEVKAFSHVMQVPPEEEANVRRLFDLAKQDVSGFEAYARRIADALAGHRQLLLDVLEGLFVVAAADGVLHEKEESFLRVVAEVFGLTDSEFRYVRALFVSDAGNPYELLGLSPAASDDEVRTRHRKLVREGHPDRLMGRGVPPELVAAASRKLAAINAAYDVIRQERGF